MNLHQEVRTDWRLWLLCGASMFQLLGFVEFFFPGKGDPKSFWQLASEELKLVAGQPGENWMSALSIACFSVSLAILAAMLSWPIQAAIVTIRAAVRTSAEKQPSRPN